MRTVQAVEDIETALKKGKVNPDNIQPLTGTMRGLERDRMASKSSVFARFSPNSSAEPAKSAVYLICTSAGEVGVDMSADHLICDLSTYENMAQRFGRVNRYGDGNARIMWSTRPGSTRKTSHWKLLVNGLSIFSTNSAVGRMASATHLRPA